MTLSVTAVSGVKWSSVSQFGRQLIQFITTAVLARVLAPSDFGLVGMATVVTGFVALFHDLGTSAAVIHREEISDDLLSSIFWVNIGFGTLAMMILYLLSPLFASLYRDPRVEPVLKLLSVTFFISGLSILQQALLEREMAFNRLARLEIISTFGGAIIGVAAALRGFGVWSLVYQTLAATLITTSLLWTASHWRPKLSFHFAEVISVSSYSLNLTGFNIFNYFVRNADYFLIARYLGARDLGFYTLAYRIMIYPLQSISSVIGRVMFPLYSRIQEDVARFRNIYLLVAGSIALLTFPVMFGLWALVREFVVAVFGDQWEPVALLLAILAPVGMMQSVGTTVGSIYQAKGRTDVMFRWGIVAGMVVLIAFVIGLQWGIVGVASAYAVASALLAYPNFAIPFRLIDLHVADFGKALKRPFLCSLLMFGTLLLLKALLPSDLSTKVAMALCVAAGIVVYLAASWRINRENLREVAGLIGLKI